MEKVLILVEPGLNSDSISHIIIREVAKAGDLPVLGTTLTDSGFYSFTNDTGKRVHHYKPYGDLNPPSPGTALIDSEALNCAIFKICDRVIYGTSNSLANVGLTNDPVYQIALNIKRFGKPIEKWSFGGTNENPTNHLLHRDPL